MRTLIVLLVTVVGSGGPAPVDGGRPPRLRDATVTVRHHGRLVATSRRGKLDVALPPGRYVVSSGLGPPAVSRPLRCQARTVRLSRGTARVRVTLACSIK